MSLHLETRCCSRFPRRSCLCCARRSAAPLRRAAHRAVDGRRGRKKEKKLHAAGWRLKLNEQQIHHDCAARSRGPWFTHSALGESQQSPFLTTVERAQGKV